MDFAATVDMGTPPVDDMEVDVDSSRIDEELSALFAEDSEVNIRMDNLVEPTSPITPTDVAATAAHPAGKTLEELVDEMIRLQQGPDAATNEKNKFRVEYLLNLDAGETIDSLHKHIARVLDPETGSLLSPLEQLHETFPATTSDILSKRIILLQKASNVQTELFLWKLWVILLFAHFTDSIDGPEDGQVTTWFDTEEFNNFFVKKCNMSSFQSAGKNHFLVNFIYNQRSVRKDKIATARKGTQVVQITFRTSP